MARDWITVTPTPAGGAQALAGRLGVAGDQLADLGVVTHEAAQMVYRAAFPNTPRRSGRLARSLTVVDTPEGSAVASPLVYAGVINFGWRARNIRPQPWLTRAASQSVPDMLALFEKYVQTTVDKIGD